MHVRCCENQIHRIVDDDRRQHIGRYVHLAQIDIAIGATSTVYGVLFWEGVPWYLICEQPDDDYPRPHCSVHRGDAC